MTQGSARLNQNIFHLPDRSGQRTRDDRVRAGMAAKLDSKQTPDGNPELVGGPDEEQVSV